MWQQIWNRGQIMTLIDAVNNLYSTYGKYGLDKGKIWMLICDGMKNYGLSVETCYNGLRMTLGREYNEQELFSSDEVAEMLGVSKEEILQEIEKCKIELEAKGEDTSRYFIPVQNSFTFLYQPDNEEGGKNKRK